MGLIRNILYIVLLLMITLYASAQTEVRPKYAPHSDKHKNVFDEFEKKQGLHKYYTRDGVLLSEIEYVDNKKHGSCKKYFTENGKLREESNYFNGKKDGEFKKYNSRDKIIQEGSYKNGKKDGHFVTNNGVSGEPKMEGNYKDGKPNGEFKFFTSKGTLFSQGSYANGRRNGDWVIYDSDGNIIKTEKYKDGVLFDPAAEQQKANAAKNTKPTKK